ncbi:hypothetical protein AOLI_G00046970 [Acnodon oligacanthus]
MWMQMAASCAVQMWASTQVRMSRDFESGAQVRHPQHRAGNSTRMKKGHQRKRDGERWGNKSPNKQKQDSIEW